MNRRYRLTKTNLLTRLLVGVLVLFFLYQGITDHRQEKQRKNTSLLPVARAKLIVSSSGEDSTARLIKLAQTDHIALLKWALERYENRIQDYSVTFCKQERINGKLKPVEKISVLFKDTPHSVLMQWKENAGSVDKLLYVEGANENKMVVHPTGIWAWIKSVKRDPSGTEARQSSRGTCDQFGFYRTMKNLLEVYEQAQAQGDLQTRYIGDTQVHGRACVAMERLLPPKDHYPYARLVMAFDKEYLLPIAISCYDWQDNLMSQYTFSDLKFNVGLSKTAFTPAVNNL